VVRTLCDVAVSQDEGRLTAVKCLVETADEGDELAIEACLRVSEDSDATIRLEAVQVRHDRRLRQSRAKTFIPTITT
jgi:hypothetical protein